MTKKLRDVVVLDEATEHRHYKKLHTKHAEEIVANGGDSTGPSGQEFDHKKGTGEVESKTTVGRLMSDIDAKGKVEHSWWKDPHRVVHDRPLRRPAGPRKYPPGYFSKKSIK